MDTEPFANEFHGLWLLAQSRLSETATYVQAGVIIAIYFVAYWMYAKTIKRSLLANNKSTSITHPLGSIVSKLGSIVYPLIAIVLLRISLSVGEATLHSVWLINVALTIAVLLFAYFVIKEFVTSTFMSALFRWIGLPILLLHLVELLPSFIKVLEEISLTIGNIQITLYGLTRVLFFGALLFWLGRTSNNVGKDIIRNQHKLDISTREVFSKLFEVGLFCIFIILLLNIMGVNLTALAVFGGAVGVGLGLGLQSIASNFISGIIILLDKSLTIGDFIELEDGKKGFVREFKMRHAVLETYDGKDILVPNEVFISSLLINWTHKDPKQRYRVDFSVAYATDVRAMVEIIKRLLQNIPKLSVVLMFHSKNNQIVKLIVLAITV